MVLATKFGMDMEGLNGTDFGARGSRRYIVRAAAGGISSTECQHLRVALDSPARGDGEMVQLAAFPQVQPAPAPFAEPTPHLRVPLAITVSLTQMSRDPAPVLSVRVAWARTSALAAGAMRTPDSMGVEAPVPEALAE